MKTPKIGPKVAGVVYLAIAAGNAAIALSKIAAGNSEAWVFLVSFAGLCTLAVRSFAQDCAAPRKTTDRLGDAAHSLLLAGAAGLLVATNRFEAVLAVAAYAALLYGNATAGQWLLAAYYALGLPRVVDRPATVVAHSFALGFYALKATRVLA